VGPASPDGFENGKEGALELPLRSQLTERMELRPVLMSSRLKAEEIRYGMKTGMAQRVGTFWPDAVQSFKRSYEGDSRCVLNVFCHLCVW